MAAERPGDFVCQLIFFTPLKFNNSPLKKKCLPKRKIVDKIWSSSPIIFQGRATKRLEGVWIPSFTFTTSSESLGKSGSQLGWTSCRAAEGYFLISPTKTPPGFPWSPSCMNGPGLIQVSWGVHHPCVANFWQTYAWGEVNETKNSTANVEVSTRVLGQHVWSKKCLQDVDWYTVYKHEPSSIGTIGTM